MCGALSFLVDVIKRPLLARGGLESAADVEIGRDDGLGIK
jgi:hypothetical protein